MLGISIALIVRIHCSDSDRHTHQRSTNTTSTNTYVLLSFHPFVLGDLCCRSLEGFKYRQPGRSGGHSRHRRHRSTRARSTHTSSKPRGKGNAPTNTDDTLPLYVFVRSVRYLARQSSLVAAGESLSREPLSGWDGSEDIARTGNHTHQNGLR